MKLPDAALLNYTTGSYFSSVIRLGIIHCWLHWGKVDGFSTCSTPH